MPTVPNGSYPRTTDRGEIERRASPRVKGFLAFWDARRAGRPCPLRSDMDPVDMRPWLGEITLVERVGPGLDLRYRLVGSNHVDLRGYNPVGRPVFGNHFGASVDAVRENYRLVLDEGRVVYDWDGTLSTSGLMREAETLLLPLARHDPATIDMAIVLAVTVSLP